MVLAESELTAHVNENEKEKKEEKAASAKKPADKRDEMVCILCNSN